LYQQAGYKLREIADLEYQNGALESRNIETIKSRLFLARQQLQTLLTRDGNRRPTGEENQDDIFGDY
jgi:DNA-directed RNA polymerase specialized sigma24 family protein